MGAAKNASFKDEVQPEDGQNTALEIKLEEKIIGKDLWKLISGSTVYIQEVDPKTSAYILGTRKKVRILPTPF